MEQEKITKAVYNLDKSYITSDIYNITEQIEKNQKLIDKMDSEISHMRELLTEEYHMLRDLQINNDNLECSLKCLGLIVFIGVVAILGLCIGV